MRPPPPELDPERLRSQLWLRFFLRVLTRQLRRSFHAVRLAKPGVPAVAAELPLIVYCNHPSWWDGALLPVLVTQLFPERRAFAPIDAEALQRYGFMRRVGVFGVQPGRYEGAATFLRIGRSVLSRPDTVFCLMPEGRFVDARSRPLVLKPGLAGLIARVPRVTALPLALEYPFWSERTPEALARFGEPQVMGRDAPASFESIQASLESRLSVAMDRLSDDAASRDPGRFERLLQGQAGVGGAYDLWRRLKAWCQGRTFDPAHSPGP